jgi:hypothetical protein
MTLQLAALAFVVGLLVLAALLQLAGAALWRLWRG